MSSGIKKKKKGSEISQLLWLQKGIAGEFLRSSFEKKILAILKSICCTKTYPPLPSGAHDVTDPSRQPCEKGWSCAAQWPLVKLSSLFQSLWNNFQQLVCY